MSEPRKAQSAPGSRPKFERVSDPEDSSPRRILRVPEPLWVAACEKAAKTGRRPSAVFRDLLRAYVADERVS